MKKKPFILMAAGAAGIAGASLVMRHLKKQYSSSTIAFNHDGRFIDATGLGDYRPGNNTILSESCRLSMDSSKTHRNSNVFAVGGAGSGKTYNLVIPNILQSNSSFVVTDHGGALLKQYGRQLEENGYRIKVLNLERTEQGNHYNPFAYIRSERDVASLAHTIISNTGDNTKGGDPFWEKSEEALLNAVIAYLWCYIKPEQQNFVSMNELLQAIEVDESDPSVKTPLDYLFEEVEEKDPDGYAVKQYKTFKLGAGRTQKSIAISCAVRLQMFNLQEFADLTNTDDIGLDAIADEKTALFIVLSNGSTLFNFLSSALYTQLFERMYNYCETETEYSTLIVDCRRRVWKTFRAKNPAEVAQAEEDALLCFDQIRSAKIVLNEKTKLYEIVTASGDVIGWRGTKPDAEAALDMLQGGKVVSNLSLHKDGHALPIHLRFIMDEFASLGRIDQFAERMATMRKYNMSAMVIVQSIHQLKDLYKSDWEVIVGNCDSWVFLGGGTDMLTADWLSGMLVPVPKDTIRKRNRLATAEGYTATDIRHLPEDKCIVLIRGFLPLVDTKFDPKGLGLR